ncbi:MAG TPA: NYN domain-containing protein, partial [Thermoanaerobaculia bacterium]
MPYFLDGNNLIGLARSTSRPSEEDRAALLAEVADRLRKTRARIVVFFDGGRSPQVHLGNLSVRTSATQSADDLILSEIGRVAAPREITVVTADRGLASRARALQARVLSPGEFWERVGKTSAPPD